MERKRHNRRSLHKIRTIQLILVLSLFINLHTYANDIAAFKLTGFRGYLEIPYSSDTQTLWHSGSQLSDKTRTITEGTVHFFTESYVYHPKLLYIDLGLSTSYASEQFDSGTGSVSSDDSPYSIEARMLFLGAKPYPITLFFNRRNQMHGNSLDQYESNFTNKGFNLILQQPLSPVKISIDGSSSKSEGIGFDYRYDDKVDVYSFRSEISNEKYGNHQLTYNNKSVVSSSGSIYLPVQKSELKSEGSLLNSRLTFGENRKLQLNNQLAYLNQESVRPQEEFRLDPKLMWHHSKDLRSYYRLSYLDSKQKQVDTKNQSLSAGFQNTNQDGPGYGVEIHRTANNTTGSKNSSYGVSANISSSYQFSFGQLSLSASAGFDISDQKVISNPQIIGEPLSLTGVTPVRLAKEHIIRSSIRVFEVFTGGTEQERTVESGTSCAGGFDILIISIGIHTELVNCNGIAATSISVKVDYQYDSGGTVGYLSSSYNYQANLDLFDYYRIYLRHRDKNHTVRSGFATLPREEVESTMIGAQVDYPLYGTLKLGSEIIYERQRGTFTSSNRNELKLYLQMAVFRGNLILSHDQVRQNYIGLIQDTDLVRSSLHFNARPWPNTSLSLEISEEKDTGGIVSRSSKYQSLSLEWRLRLLRLKTEVRLAEDQYGLSGRDQSRILVTLRRDF